VLALLHLCDSLFPIGGYAHSDGLESAVKNRTVIDAGGLQHWMDAVLDEAIGRCDGPALVAAHTAFLEENWPALIEIDSDVTALRPSSAGRTASRSMGMRLLRTWDLLHPDDRLRRAIALGDEGVFGPVLPIGFAAVCACAGIDARESVEGFAYTRLAATVSAAMRLMPIGQHEAHAILGRTLDRAPSVVDAILSRRAAPESFMPITDIAQMTHQYVHSRLFRS
jgi:urease accessory protein